MSRKFYPVVSILFLLFFSLPLFSQSFKQLKDINPGTAGSSYFGFTNINGVLYFKPDDGVHGDELWKTDGTEAGTVMIMDINPGTTGSDLQELINVNGILYFQANDGVHGSELWKSDGTEAGTVMVKDIYSGMIGSTPSSLFTANGFVYFQANDGLHGTELWKSDGTPAGTILLKDIYPGVIPGGYSAGIPYNSNPNNFTEINGTVYFNASGGPETHQVWKTDGTVTGTVLVKDIYTGIAGYALNNFISLNGSLLLTVYGGPDGNELWKSDGSAGGTSLVKALPGGNFFNHATILNGTLYFLEGDGLWKSDGTETGTVLIKQKEGLFNSSPELLIAVDGLLYFTLNDDTHGMELWKSDGTPAGTELLKDIYAGSNSSDINSFAKVGNRLFFSANDGIYGNELWVSDGTVAGTKLLQDIEPGPASSMPSLIYEMKGTIVLAGEKLFTAASTFSLGNEVWVTNTPANGLIPAMLLDFNGSLINSNGFLQWKTKNEVNTSVFILERSIDAVNYTSIGTFLASNTVGIHHYSFTDPNIASLGVSVVYYRLKQIDLDGKFKYANIVSLSIENKKMTVSLYPNPVSNHINLTITSPQSQKLQWRIMDKVGRLIKSGAYSVSQGVNYISEDIGFVSNGVYFIQLFNDTDSQQVIKILKQ